MEGWRVIGTSVCMSFPLSVCKYIHLSICLCICLYVLGYVHTSVCLFIHPWDIYWDICVSIRYLCVKAYIHSSTLDVYMYILTCKMCVWSSDSPGAACSWVPLTPWGSQISLSIDTVYSAKGFFFHYSGCFLLCSVFCIKSQINVPSTTPPVAVLCSNALSITMTVTAALTTVALATLDHC